MRLRHSARGALLIASLGLLTGCVNDVTDALIEQPLGALSQLAVSLQFRTDSDPALQGYTNLLGGEAKALVRRKNVPYRFKVVDVDEPNAFAIPWGGIYVTRGLLRFAESEDELAFVIGHEVGHVERRHGSLAFQRNLIVMVGLSLLTSNNNENWMQFAYLGNQFLDLHWSRENEHSADREGVMYAINMGQDPARGLDFFTRLDQKYGAVPRFWSYFQTHPINRDRISVVKNQPYLAEDAAMLTLIGDGYRKRSRYRSAQERFERAVAADGNYGPAHLGLARCAAWRGDVKVARQHYLTAVEHGVDYQEVSGELAALPATAPDEPVPAFVPGGELTALQGNLERLGTDLAAVRSLGEPVWREPLDSAQALVASHTLAGTQLDRLYALNDSLPRPLQEIVVVGQKLRGTALRAASRIGAAQEEAQEAVEQAERNRQRVLAKLRRQPTRQVVQAAQAVLLDATRGGDETRDGVQRLNETAPTVRKAVQAGHQSIGYLAQMNRSTRPGHATERLRDNLEATDHAIELALNEAARGEGSIYGARVRALQSSIDITMVDRPAHEREAARRILERFLGAEEAQLDLALNNGLSWGETSYLLALSKSAGKPPVELLEVVRDAQQRQTVDRLGRGRRGPNQTAVILLRLIDRTLQEQFEPTT